MTKRDVVRDVFENRKPAYVPWSIGLNHEVAEALADYFGSADVIEDKLQNHFAVLGHPVHGPMVRHEGDIAIDYFGVHWDQSIDKDCGSHTGLLLPEPTLDGFTFPDPEGDLIYAGAEEILEKQTDRWRVWHIGFSLFERAWSLRGMENLLADFYEEPEFVHELLGKIADYQCKVITHAAGKLDLDCVFFGDDWGMQTGLMMGPKLWDEFIRPYATQMYQHTHSHGLKVLIHSCGKVESLFEDIITAGVDCFNPFQPEVMDVHALLRQYRGRLSFHGGMSTQKTLPFGTREDVIRDTNALIESGRDGNLVFSPAHVVDGDVPYQNVLTFIEVLQAQPGAPKGL
jgi:Uroporphyrinogen-III decarboxylase